MGKLLKAKKDNIEALGDNVLKRLGDLNDDALNEHFETRQSLFLAMLSCGRRPHSQHSPHSSPVGEAVGNSAERRQTETDLLWNMDVAFRGWGSKEESTVVDKEVSELSVSQKKYAANSQKNFLLKCTYSHTASVAEKVATLIQSHTA